MAWVDGDHAQQRDGSGARHAGDLQSADMIEQQGRAHGVQKNADRQQIPEDQRPARLARRLAPDFESAAFDVALPKSGNRP